MRWRYCPDTISITYVLTAPAPLPLPIENQQSSIISVGHHTPLCRRIPKYVTPSSAG